MSENVKAYVTPSGQGGGRHYSTMELADFLREAEIVQSDVLVHKEYLKLLIQALRFYTHPGIPKPGSDRAAAEFNATRANQLTFNSRPQPNRDIATLVEYMQSCVRRRDWHGVADAATDIRVIEAIDGAAK